MFRIFTALFVHIFGFVYLFFVLFVSPSHFSSNLAEVMTYTGVCRILLIRCKNSSHNTTAVLYSFKADIPMITVFIIHWNVYQKQGDQFSSK